MRLIETAGEPDIPLNGRWSDDPWSEGLRRDLKQVFTVGAIGTLLTVSSGTFTQSAVRPEPDSELVATAQRSGGVVLQESLQTVKAPSVVPDASQGEDVDEWAPRIPRGKSIRVVARRSDRTLEPDWDL